MLAGGGLTAEGFEETNKKLEKYTARNNLKKAADAYVDAVSVINSIGEYATSMAIYNFMRNEGKAVNEAINYARSVTVNFCPVL